MISGPVNKMVFVSCSCLLGFRMPPLLGTVRWRGVFVFPNAPGYDDIYIFNAAIEYERTGLTFSHCIGFSCIFDSGTYYSPKLIAA